VRTVQNVTAALASELNRLNDERPALRERAQKALRDARRRLDNLVMAVESGGGTSSLLEAVRAREADIQRLTYELDELAKPLEQKLKVIPTWVRQQLEDVVGLLSETPEKTKAEFKRLGVSFTLYPVRDEGARPFLRSGGRWMTRPSRSGSGGQHGNEKCIEDSQTSTHGDKPHRMPLAGQFTTESSS
jgi:ElaB/YqjD/DUF883 family membrane-anchored ribosome-binding protein